MRMTKNEALILLGGALGLGVGIFLCSKNFFGLGQTSVNSSSYLLGAYDQRPRWAARQPIADYLGSWRFLPSRRF